MTTAARMGQLLHKSYFGPAWHGPAVAELLADVSAAQAVAQPAVGTHSIWTLVLHMMAWKDEVRRRLTGPGRKLSPEENWPPIADTSEAAWRQTLERLTASQQALEDAIANLTDEQWAGGAAEDHIDREELLHVIIHHDLYHAGQIAILKTQSKKRGIAAPTFL
ncbi:MAG TPA: DinB family protein [Pirellulales bacterium]|jgi:uncharacterized damage-inducible protein DinB